MINKQQRSNQTCGRPLFPSKRIRATKEARCNVAKVKGQEGAVLAVLLAKVFFDNG